MSLYFNAPPGWPPAPSEDWRPPEGWKPDPSWPPAPEGWEFWVAQPVVQDGVLAITPPEGRRSRRGRRAALMAGVAVVVFLLGLVIGQGNSARTLDDAQDVSAAAAAERDDVDAERAALEEEAAAVETARAEAEALRAELDQRETTVATRETDIGSRETAVAQLEADVAARVADVESREGAVTQAEADLAARSRPAPSSPPAPSTAPAPSTTTYYQNCDAVRAAGAAPLLAGQPGYAPKLDRDGDGVACE